MRQQKEAYVRIIISFLLFINQVASESVEVDMRANVVRILSPAFRSNIPVVPLVHCCRERLSLEQVTGK